MFKCPECGTEYTVVPDACAVCGYKTDASESTDLFAKAAEQERRLADQQKKLQEQYHENAQEQQPAPDQDAEAAKPAPAEADWNAERNKPRSALKLAAVCAAAAVALGGGAFWASRGGKPEGFIRSTVGTFYVKDQDLWFQNGQTGRKICLKETFFPLKSTKVLFTEYGNMERLNEMLYVTPDGNDFYFPKTATIGTDDCVLMHCTADHPEMAEEIARINLRSGDYNSNVIFSSAASYYISAMYSLSVNSSMLGGSGLYQMNLPYVVCDGALYYRNADSEFCCTQNGETQVIAPFVERFWTMPGQNGVYYIGVPEYEDIREKREWSGEYIHTDYECMNGFVEVVLADGGEEIETQMHGGEYVLCRISPGNPAEQLVPERIEDWKPIRGDFTQYFYYSTFSPEEQVTQLRRYDFRSGTAETVYSTDPDNRISLIQDYPDGSCYLGTFKAPEPEDMQDWLPDSETLKVMYHEYGESNRYSFYVPLQDVSVYYQEAGGDPKAIPEFDGSRDFSIYSSNILTSSELPYICIAGDTENDRGMRVYYRDQDVPVTFNPETGEQGSPEYAYVTADGTRLIASVLAENTKNPDNEPPHFRAFCGTLNGAGEVRLDLLAECDYDTSIAVLELENEPAEVLCIKSGDMYSGEEKIASGVLNALDGRQPEYRQLCFITDEESKPSPGDYYDDVSTEYCGTLMRRADRKTETVAERVTDFIPFDKEQFMVICGEKGENGELHYYAGEKQYQVDTDVSNLVGLKTLAKKSLLERLLS